MKQLYIFPMIMLILIIYTYQESQQYLHPDNMISFLNIGQGDASLIMSDRGDRILIDCGPNETIVDRLESKLGFWSQRLDILIITHGDKDHYGGCESVIQRYKVGKIMINGVFDEKNTDYERFLQLVQSQNIQVLPAMKETYISLGNILELQILNPQTNLWGQNIRDDNPESIVIQVISPHKKILLTGDIDTATEERIVKTYPHLDIDVLKAGHHGSNTSTGDILLDHITPEQVIISAGQDNPYNHPHPEVINRLQKRNIDIIQTKDFLIGFDILL